MRTYRPANFEVVQEVFKAERAEKRLRQRLSRDTAPTLTVAAT